MVVVAKGVAVVLWVRVHGQLVIVRVVAWADVSWEMPFGTGMWYIAHRGCGVRLIVLHEGSGIWAVGGVGCDNVSRGDDDWRWDTRSNAGAVVSSPGVGNTSDGGHSDDSRLHCECGCWFCGMNGRLGVRDSIKRLINLKNE